MTLSKAELNAKHYIANLLPRLIEENVILFCRLISFPSSVVRLIISDVKFHEFFWREIFHETFREIFLKY